MQLLICHLSSVVAEKGITAAPIEYSWPLQYLVLVVVTCCGLAVLFWLRLLLGASWRE
jgi:hypothetical protein